MNASPDPPVVTDLVAQNQFPAALLDQFGAMSFVTVGAAHRLGVFDALSEGPASASELAVRIDCDPGATGVLLDALVAYDYLEVDGSGYRNGAQVTTWLCADGQDGFAAVVTFWHDALTSLWSSLPDVVRTGKPSHDFYDWLAEDASRLRGFGVMQDAAAADLAGPLASLIAPMVVADEPLVLDVGGGWGRYAEALCRAMPNARATVLELPETAAQGAERLATSGLDARIEFVSTDLRVDPIAGPCDVVLLANVLHTFDVPVARDLVRRASATLRPGGHLVVVDHLADLLDRSDPIRRAQGRGFDLHLLQTQTGQLPTYDMLCEWISEAGLGTPELRMVEEFPIHHVVVAVAPSDRGDS